jgi:hypothetical protein
MPELSGFYVVINPGAGSRLPAVSTRHPQRIYKRRGRGRAGPLAHADGGYRRATRVPMMSTVKYICSHVCYRASLQPRRALTVVIKRSFTHSSKLTMPLPTSSVYPPPSGEFMKWPSRRSVVHSTKGIVACTQPLAAKCGIDILNAGGNAAVSRQCKHEHRTPS